MHRAIPVSLCLIAMLAQVLIVLTGYAYGVATHYYQFPFTAMSPFPRTLYWLTPALSVLLVLGLAELGLAFLAPVPFVAEVDMYYEADAHTGFRLKAGSKGVFRTDHHQVDFLLPGELDQVGDVAIGDIDVCAHLGGAGIARGDI